VKLLQRILLDRDRRYVFATIGGRFVARVDSGRVDDGRFDHLCQSYSKPHFLSKVSAGWRVAVPEVWRRKTGSFERKGETVLRYLAFRNPHGAVIVLEFFQKQPPAVILDDLRVFLGSLSSGGELSNAGPQSQEQDNGRDRELQQGSFSGAEVDSAAEGHRGVDVEELQGGAGEFGTEDGFSDRSGDSPSRRGLEVTVAV
jgi:hypothetical protein